MRIWRTHPVLFLLLLVTSGLFLLHTFGVADPTHAHDAPVADGGAVTMTFATVTPEEGARMDVALLPLCVAILWAMAVLVLTAMLLTRRCTRAIRPTLTRFTVRLN